MHFMVRFIEPRCLKGMDLIKDPGFRLIFKNSRSSCHDGMMHPYFDAIWNEDRDIANDIPKGNDGIPLRQDRAAQIDDRITDPALNIHGIPFIYMLSRLLVTEQLILKKIPGLQ